MRAVTKKEAYQLYDTLTALAQAAAATQGTTPDNCNDPICNRWRRFKTIDEIDEDYLLLLTESESPMFLLNEKGIVDDFMNGGIMTVPAEGFKIVHRDDNMLTVEYTDGTIELYEAQKDLTDVYQAYSSNRVSIMENGEW